MRAQPILEQVDDAAARKRGIDCKICGCTRLHEQRTGRIQLHHLAVALELPRSHGATRESAQQTGVFEKVARMAGSAASIEVVARRGRGEALDAWANGNRDHVLLQP